MSFVAFHVQRIWPGLALATLVSMAAVSLSEQYLAPVMLLALLLGMAVNFLSQDQRCKPGIEFAARHVLRWGVALLGMKITVDQIYALGWIPAALVAVVVVATIVFGVLISKWLGFQAFFGFLSGGAVAICGASAAMAIAAAFPHHPQKDRATLFVVISVSTLSTIAMVLYPMACSWLSLDTQKAGYFLGGTIHDVAQVVGAAYSVSAETGDVATIVKLLRVAMLAPVIVVASWLTRVIPIQLPEHEASQTPSSFSRPPLLPGFVLAFAALLLLGGFELIPQAVQTAGATVSRWCLVASMAAIGMKTHLKDILSVGWKPVFLMVLETLFLAAIVAVAIRMVPMH